MLRHKGQRRQVFHGGSRSAKIINVAANASKKRAKRLERVQLGYQLKHLRAKAFKCLPPELQTAELRKAMYDLSSIDKQQAVLRPTPLGPRAIGDNIMNVQYHDGEYIDFNRDKLAQVLTFVQDPHLRHALVEFENRYAQLTHEIRADQFPTVPTFPRPVTSRKGKDLLEVNEQFKISEDMLTPEQKLEMVAKVQSLPQQQKQHIEQLSALYTKVAKLQNDPNASMDDIEAAYAEIQRVPFQVAELNLLHIPPNVKAVPAMTARVFQMMVHPIDYLDLYKAVFRGRQPVMSKKLINEINIMKYAVEHLTDAEFKMVNPHRVAIIVWKLMNSDDVDNDTVTTVLRYIHRMSDREDRALIHSNPEIMADSWIVEAFNNRNNPSYSQELLRGAKAADSDLNRFKLFLHDTEKVPRRLGIFLGMHYVKVKRTLPPYAIEPFFHSLNYCRYPGQVNTILNAIVTAAPDLRVPPGGIFEAMVAAHKLNEISTIQSLSNYLRHSTGLGPTKVLPMPYRIGSIYIDSLQSQALRDMKHYDNDINSETTAVLKDMIARGQVPHVFSHDIIDAFLIPEVNPVTGELIDVQPLIGGNTDPRFAATSTDNLHERAVNFNQLHQQQVEQDQKLSPHLKTFNINIQNHMLPSVAFTAINYSLRTLQNYANTEGLTFRKPVRIYAPNMKSVLEEFNRKTLATDRVNSSATSKEIQLDLDGNPMRPIVNKYTGEQASFGVQDIAQIPKDADNLPTLPIMNADPNTEYKNLSRIFDAADMFDDVSAELQAPISPHVAHLVEQAIPTISFNPHIYDDVLDIIRIKTGLVVEGQEDIGGFTGLRNPDKIDEFLAKEIEVHLQSMGIQATMNKRFGYFEISVDEMNKFLTRNPDQMLRDHTLVREKYLQALEENRRFIPHAKAWRKLSPTPEESDDDIGISLQTQKGWDDPQAYARQQLRTMKFATPTGIPLTDKELLDQHFLSGHRIDDAKKQEDLMRDLGRGIDNKDIPFPISLQSPKF